jgi:Sap, sulfolipid-1-addressing protein
LYVVSFGFADGFADRPRHCRLYLPGGRVWVGDDQASAATQVLAVIVFVLIEFSLIIVPFVFLELWPEATKAALKNAQDWLLSRARLYWTHGPL